ncbi:MAG: hypothetical protein ACHQYP_10605, partial [Nitrospiria bacterium]
LIVGTFKWSGTFSDDGSNPLNAGGLCGGLNTGTITITASSSTTGAFLFALDGEQSRCVSGTTTFQNNMSAGSFTNTFTILPNGSGTLTTPLGPAPFQFSQDLNSLVINAINPVRVSQFVGIRK